MAFHPYPQLIPPVFNPGGYGPPRALTHASTWPWVDHPASGPYRATHNRPLQTRFRYGSPTRVNLATRRRLAGSFFNRHATTPTPHKARREALTACRRPVSGTLSLPSRGTFHHSLTVLSTIGHQEVFRQPSGLGRLTQDSTSPVLQRENALHAHNQVPPTGLSPTPARHPRRFSYPATHAPHPGRDENRRTPTTPPPQPLPGHHTTTV